MAIYFEEDSKQNRIKAIAEEMLIAARTAPKGRGRDTLEMMIIDGDEIEKLASKMEEISKEFNQHFFERDAHTIRACSAVILIGTRIETLGLNEVCQLCGFHNCEEKNKHPETPCVFNVSDLNISLGSAVSVAADHRVDNRIMFSVGKAALQLNFFTSDIKIAFGIPLSVSSKNILFDRK